MKERFSQSLLYQFSVPLHIHTGTRTSTRIFVHDRDSGISPGCHPLSCMGSHHWPYQGSWALYWQQFTRSPAPLHQEARFAQSPLPTPQHEMFEEQEVRADKGVTPQNHISSSSPDEVVMPLPPSMAANFCQFQVLCGGVAATFRYLLGRSKTRNSSYWTFCSQQHPPRLVLPINEALLDPRKTM